MSKHSKHYGVGRIVRLREEPTRKGRIMGASHAQDRYLIMWDWNTDARSQGLHSRMELLPAEKVQ